MLALDIAPLLLLPLSRVTTEDVPTFPERASESALSELIEVDPAVAVLCVEDGLAPAPDEMELSTDEPAGDDNPVVDEPEPIGPVSVGKPFDPLNAPLLGEDPVPREEPLLREDPLPMDEPPVELLLPVASCAHAEPGERMVAPISNVEAPKALESFLVMADYPVLLVRLPQSVIRRPVPSQHQTSLRTARREEH